MPEEKEKKDLYYTKIFEKCYPKSKETGEFEECCKDEVNKATSKIMTPILESLKDVAKKDIFDRTKEIGKKEVHKKLDEIEKKLNDRESRE